MIFPESRDKNTLFNPADFKINYERIVNIHDIQKLKKLKCFLEFISKKISKKNPLVSFYSDLIEARLNNDETKKFHPSSIKGNNSFWKSRLDVLMKDTYDML